LENYPLVTVICLCFNHQDYVIQALQSVINQTYSNIQLIVADDASEDDSQKIISKFIINHPEIIFIKNEQNLGNCSTFNKAFAFAKGKYIIDLSADDLLLNNRVSKQVTDLEELPEKYGVIFSDVFYINEKTEIIGRQNKPQKIIPSGDIYEKVLESFFISSPSMMIRKSVLDDLGGYDENLAYEDFDFWVRSSRKYFYYYSPDALTLKRKLPSSLSNKFYLQRQYKLQISTYLVCEKAFILNVDEAENKALAKRVKYQLRQAYISGNGEVIENYKNLLNKLNMLDVFSKTLLFLNRSGIKPNKTYFILRKLNITLLNLVCNISYKVKYKFYGIKSGHQSS